MSEATISIRKAILIVAVSCILSSVSTWGIINVTPRLVPAQVSESQIRILRFFEPNIRNVTGIRDTSRRGLNVRNFVWTPDNPENNAILAVHCYFEYRCENPSPNVWSFEFGLRVNDFYPNDEEHCGLIIKGTEYQGQWEQTSYFAYPNVKFSRGSSTLWIDQNQNSYNITLWVRRSLPETLPAYVRNINIIIEVIDGIPVET